MDESNDPNDKGFATGEDNFSGGFAIVGESYPDLPNYPHVQTSRTNNASGSTEINFTVHAPDNTSIQVTNPYNSVCSGGGSLLTFGSLIGYHSPEMVFIPPNPAFGYLEIVRAVAETDSIFHTTTDYDDVPCGWCCPFCTGYIRGRRYDVPEFPHDDNCIVFKARAMVEAMPHVE